MKKERYCHTFATLPGWKNDSTVESETEYYKKLEQGLYQHSSYVTKTFDTLEEAEAHQEAWLEEE